MDLQNCAKFDLRIIRYTYIIYHIYPNDLRRLSQSSNYTIYIFILLLYSFY